MYLIGNDDGTRAGKLVPDIYLQAARNLGLVPAECVVEEDSRSGVRAAHAAGIGCTVAMGPLDKHYEPARLARVRLVIESLRELPK